MTLSFALWGYRCLGFLPVLGFVLVGASLARNIEAERREVAACTTLNQLADRYFESQHLVVAVASTIAESQASDLMSHEGKRLEATLDEWGKHRHALAPANLPDVGPLGIELAQELTQAIDPPGKAIPLAANNLLLANSDDHKRTALNWLIAANEDSQAALHTWKRGVQRRVADLGNEHRRVRMGLLAALVLLVVVQAGLLWSAPRAFNTRHDRPSSGTATPAQGVVWDPAGSGLVDALPCLTWMADEAGQLTFVNQRWAEVTGDPVDVLLGQGYLNRVYPEDQTAVRAAMDAVPGKGAAREFEARVWHAASQSYRWFLGRVVPGTDAQGQPIALGSALDIHQQKHRQSVLADLAEVLAEQAELLDLALDAIYALDLDGVIRTWNHAAADRYGWTRDEALGRSISELLGEDEGLPTTTLQNLVRRNGSWEGEQVHRSRDGRTIYVFTRWAVQRDAQGHPRGFLVSSTDITLRRSVQKALHASLERLDLAARGGTDGLWDWDLLRGTSWYSPRFKELLGYSEEDFEDTMAAFERHVMPEDRIALRQAIEKHLRDSLPFDHEFRMRTRSGEMRWFRLRAQSVRTPEGRAIRMAGSLSDVSKHREYEAQLEQQAQQLAQSNADLESFAYAASHDLQEPVRAIHGLLGLLRNRAADALDDDSRRLIDSTLEAAGRMQRLIRGLMDYARLNSKPFQGIETDCGKVLDGVLADLAVAIHERQATITTTPLPTVWTDPGQLAQLFQNLLSNAIRFSGDGPPQIEISSIRVGDRWEIAIRDHGEGIAPEYHQRIFELFQRLHTSSEGGGAGIGLALCRRIAERVGGKIWVDSQPNQGATFTISLPADRDAFPSRTTG